MPVDGRVFGFGLGSGGAAASFFDIAGVAAAAWDGEGESPAAAVRDLLRALSGDLEPVGDDDASGWGMPTL